MRNIYLIVDNPLSGFHAIYMCKMLDLSYTDLCIICLDKEGDYRWIQPEKLIPAYDITFITKNTEGFDMLFISNPGFHEKGIAPEDYSTRITSNFDIVISSIVKFVSEDKTGKVLINEFHNP